MQLPHRIKTNNPKHVCKLQSSFDHSLFTKKFGNSFVAILIYVDDVIIAGNNLQESTYIKAFLNNNFKIKDPGRLKYFLGIEVACTSTGIRISRKKYTLDIMKETGLVAANPASTPLPRVKEPNFSKTLAPFLLIP